MHNGQIGGYDGLRRQLENYLPDDYFLCRAGSTDSELMFLIALADGLNDHPVASVERMLGTVREMMSALKISSALRFTAAFTDGENLYGFRYASDQQAPSLYYQEGPGGLNLVSEPLDSKDNDWDPVPLDHVFIRDRSGKSEIRPLNIM